VRTPRLYTRQWIKANALRRANYIEQIRAHETVLDDKFFDAVLKRRSSVLSAVLKAYAIQVPIFALLVLSLIPIEASFSILGISPTSNKNLREILIALSALIGVGIAFLNSYHDALSEIIAAFTEKRSKGNKPLESVLKAGYGLDAMPLPPQSMGDLQLGWGYAAFLVLFGFLVVSLLAILALGSVAIHLIVLHEIYAKPSFSTGVSIAVICFVVTCDCLTLIITLANSGPILVRDFANMMTVSKMDDVRSAEIYRGMWRQHLQKPFLLRLFTRPKLPKKLSQ